MQRSAMLHSDVIKTFDRMTTHLRDNKIDLDQANLTVVPLLQIDNEG